MRMRALNTVAGSALLVDDLASVDAAILSKKAKRNIKLRIQNTISLLS